MKSFEVPIIYRSPLITAIKKKRKEVDKLKKDFTPTLLDFGPLHLYLARHFGFCYGVENAIEIAFRTVEENPGKRIFLLSEMIHNPQVNADLQAHGVQFMQDTYGKQIIPFGSLTADDVVIIPAFGTTLETEQLLQSKGIHTEKYNTTCPFVEKVWNRSEVIAKNNYTIIIHGKPNHEETRATFSHAASNAQMIDTFKPADTEEHFADTKDTLCYATNDNQTAVSGMLQMPADLAIVVGGYNSSNTSHLVELCEAQLPTYFINSAEKILPGNKIQHYNFHSRQEQTTCNFMPAYQPVKVLLTSGASCPDALVEGVITSLAEMYGVEDKMIEMEKQF
ncbi:MAG: 4-hydroxy-3-methylbut-2-enyl diphosphate reductase [Chitinophagaceae bacterium]|nr:4-hydroxy-3-methylbut-2-enyl diphosphate reductase [Chitinophagaceae bacterium]